MSDYALGLIETAGLVAAIEAADAAAKAASVVVASAELTDATYMTIRIEGDLGAVQAAVEAAAQAAERIGEIVAVHVIPNPDDGLGPILPERRWISKYDPDDNRPPLEPPGASPRTPVRPPSGIGGVASKDSGAPAPAPAEPLDVPPEEREVVLPKKKIVGLEDMTVAELRKYARGLVRLHLKGREISKANKQQLIDAIKRVMEMD